MNRKITAVLLTGIFLFSSCSSTGEESSLSTLSSMTPSPSAVNTSSEIDFEVGPIDINTKEYMLPASIDRTDSLAAVYDGENIVTLPISLDWYTEEENQKYDIDKGIDVFSFKDNFVWTHFFDGGRGFGAMNSNIQVFPRSLYLFPNDQVGVIFSDPSEGIRVFKNNGDLAVLLNFNYGIDVLETDPDFFDKAYLPISMENVPIGITYSESLEQYVVFYTKNADFPNLEEERDPDNEFNMKVHVAIFDKKGNEVDDFSLDNFYFQYAFKGSFIPIQGNSIYSREKGIILLNTSYDGLATVNLIQKTVNTAPSLSEIEPLLNESPNIIMDDPTYKSYKLTQDLVHFF